MGSQAAPRLGELPRSPAAEEALIGMVLLDDFEVWGELEGCTLYAEDFFSPANQMIWKAFAWMTVHGWAITCPTTVTALSELGYLEAVDRELKPSSPEEYLFRLLSQCYSARSAITFARIIHDYADRRDRIRKGTAMVTEAYNGTPSRSFRGEIEL